MLQNCRAVGNRWILLWFFFDFFGGTVWICMTFSILCIPFLGKSDLSNKCPNRSMFSVKSDIPHIYDPSHREDFIITPHVGQTGTNLSNKLTTSCWCLWAVHRCCLRDTGVRGFVIAGPTSTAGPGYGDASENPRKRIREPPGVKIGEAMAAWIILDSFSFFFSFPVSLCFSKWKISKLQTKLRWHAAPAKLVESQFAICHVDAWGRDGWTAGGKGELLELSISRSFQKTAKMLRNLLSFTVNLGSLKGAYLKFLIFKCVLFLSPRVCLSKL